MRLIYVADPMCSWCWGFAPVLDELVERFALPVDVGGGGLRPGPAAQIVDDEWAQYLRGAWTSVAQASGQPFDFARLEQRGWLYDTELPCIAIVAMREQAPERARAFTARLQRAFYAGGAEGAEGTSQVRVFNEPGSRRADGTEGAEAAERAEGPKGVDITARQSYADLDLGLFAGYAPDPAAAVAALDDAAVRRRTWEDFERARLGRHGLSDSVAAGRRSAHADYAGLCARLTARPVAGRAHATRIGKLKGRAKKYRQCLARSVRLQYNHTDYTRDGLI